MSDDWQAQEEITVLDTPDYYFAVEEFRRGADQMLFVHLTVHNWKVSVFKQIIQQFRAFREFVVCPLYAVAGVEDIEKWEAFVTYLGFKFLTNVICENGAERRLFIHIKEIKVQHEQQDDAADPTVSAADQQPVVCAVPVPDASVQGGIRST